VPITVRALPNSCNFFDHSDTGIVGSNPTLGLYEYVSVCSVFVLSYAGGSLATGPNIVQGVLPAL
jgi:hypothetical protein